MFVIILFISQKFGPGFNQIHSSIRLIMKLNCLTVEVQIGLIMHGYFCLLHEIKFNL